MIVDAADGPPDAQINTAQAGDVVCLVGAFTLDHVFRAEVRDGVNGNLFDLQVANVTVDGAAATVTGDFDQADNVILVISASNTRLTGFEIETGIVHVASGISNVTTDNNHIFNAVVPNSNQGLIRTLGLSNGVGPGDVLIENNVIENLYGCDADDAFGTFPPCSPGTAKPWDQVSDVEHLACIVKQGTGGDHTVRNNTIGACPSLMYLKHASDDRID